MVLVRGGATRYGSGAMDPVEALRQLSVPSMPRRAPPGLPADLPWLEVAELAAVHGLAPVVSYNVQYVLGSAGVPEEVCDRLLGYYQGTLDDNVFKLVHLKRVLDGAKGAPVLLVECAAYADALYPHVAFRPLPDLRVLARRADFQLLAAAAQPHGFLPHGLEEGAMVLTDGRVRILLHETLAGEAMDLGAWERGIPAPVFGQGTRRPAIEDAVVFHVAVLARAAFASPLVAFVDLRELALGSPSHAAVWTKRPDAATVRERARVAGLTRALWAGCALTARLFPSAAEAVGALAPELSAEEKRALEETVVAPGMVLLPDRPRDLEAARRALG